MNPDPYSLSTPLAAAGVATLTSALFTCADVALTSLSDARLAATVIEAGPGFEKALTRLEDDRERVQARYLAGRVLSVSATIGSFAMALRGLALPTAETLAVGGIGLLAFLAVLETAATTGRRLADWVVPRAARYLRPIEFVLAPVAALTGTLGRWLAPRRGRKPDPRITETEVEIMVDQGAASGAIDHGNAEMIRKVLEFPDLTARDAMIPRKQVVAIPLDTPLAEIAAIVMASGHSRYPVYREDVDDVFGLLYAKDLFRVLQPREADAAAPTASPTSRLLDIVREPVKIVPESRALSDLLRDMRQSRQHMAIVVDEFGGTSGIVTLEDVIEEIVGDIRDEHEVDRASVVALPEGRLLVDASTLVCDLTTKLGHDLDPDDEYDSIGGMVVEKLGHVPAVGASVRVRGCAIIVREADEKRITRVEIVPGEETPAPAPIRSGDDDALEAS